MWMMYLIIVLLLCVTQINCNNYDPHYPASGEGLWFEGWYTRIVDFTNQMAFASIFGSYCVSGTSCNYMQDLPGYLAFVYQNFSQKFKVIETYPNATYIDVGPDERPVSSNPDFSSPPNFIWKTPDYGWNSESAISLTMPGGFTFKAVMADPIFWNPNNPGEGPEGLVMDLPLQQNWFVYSLGSQVSYSFSTPDGEIKTGTGFAHQEKNWGESFPSEWIWAEGTSADNLYHFALSGGDVPIVGPIGVHAWLIGYRSPNASWNFRPQDVPTLFTPHIDGCNGTFQIEANHLDETLKIFISAPVATFTPLAIPSQQGTYGSVCDSGVPLPYPVLFLNL
eukprot:Phypoly_transcript_07593.p1 GENE.Phypoly_transcript_07593~~Phypoly_transcript_07593.p1  ORF type:complete len:336 (+),score=43.56 Phypoly_transcript_07593:209-1216(+)